MVYSVAGHLGAPNPPEHAWTHPIPTPVVLVATSANVSTSIGGNVQGHPPLQSSRRRESRSWTIIPNAVAMTHIPTRQQMDRSKIQPVAQGSGVLAIRSISGRAGPFQLLWVNLPWCNRARLLTSSRKTHSGFRVRLVRRGYV